MEVTMVYKRGHRGPRVSGNVRATIVGKTVTENPDTSTVRELQELTEGREEGEVGRPSPEMRWTGGGGKPGEGDRTSEEEETDSRGKKGK